MLVGHSYGGAVIGEAGGQGDVRALVFVAAFCLDKGESIAARPTSATRPPLAGAATVRTEGLLTIDPAQATSSFYAQCPPLAAEAAIARLCPQPVATFVQPATVAAWHDRPSTYLLCSRDGAIHPFHQAAMAERCGEIVTLDADHSPFISATTAVVDVIERVAHGGRGPGAVKVRVGYGLGVRTRLNDEGFAAVVDALEALRFDSLWLSERIGGAAPDPVVGMAFAAGRTDRLKLGMSVMVLPGRNPVVVAKELATLDRLSGGRLLPAFGLGVADPHEQQAFGVERGERAAWFDEALAVIRACWTDERVTHDGPRFHYDGLRVEPKPRQSPPDVWLGGIAPSELRRVGRLADGWLPSFVTPRDAAAGRAVIEQVAAEHDREIEAEHFGVLVPYTLDGLPDTVMATLAARRPDLADPAELVPQGWEALVATVEAFVAAGTSKFVVLPLVEPASAVAWTDHLAEAAEVLLPLQS